MFVHYSMQGFPPGPRRVSENSHTLGKIGKKSESGQALQTSLAPELTSNKSLEEALIFQVNMTAAKYGFSSVLFEVHTTLLGFIESELRAPACLAFCLCMSKHAISITSSRGQWHSGKVRISFQFWWQNTFLHFFIFQSVTFLYV